MIIGIVNWRLNWLCEAQFFSFPRAYCVAMKFRGHNFYFIYTYKSISLLLYTHKVLKVFLPMHTIVLTFIY